MYASFLPHVGNLLKAVNIDSAIGKNKMVYLSVPSFNERVTSDEAITQDPLSHPAIKQ